MEFVDYAVLVIYFCALLCIGFSARNKQNNADDYYVGGRGMGTLPIMALWMSSWVGGATIMGSAEKSYEMGISTLWYTMSLFIGFVVFAFACAGRIKDMGDRFQHITYSDLIEERYDARTRVVSTLTMVLAYIGYIASQLLGAAHIITSITGISLGLAFIAATGITVVYTSVGGFFAVERTDRFQALLIILGITVVGVPLTWSSVGSPARLVSDLPAEYFHWGNWGWGTIFALVVSTILTFFTSMDSYTRCYAAKTKAAARNGTLLAALAALVISGSICYLGMSARVIFPEMQSGASALVSLIMDVFPIGIKGLLLVAILSAIMSTADTCILCASANLTRDVYQRFINPDASQRKIVRLGIACSAFVGVFGALIGWYFKDIMGVMIMAFTVNSAGLFVPTIGAFFWKKASARGAFWSMTLSLITVVIWYTGQSVLPGSGLFAIDPVWPGLLVSIGVFFSLSLSDLEAGKDGPAHRKMSWGHGAPFSPRRPLGGTPPIP